MSQLLAGARIILTRPEGDSGALAQALRQVGAQTLSFPALTLQPSADAPPVGPFDLAVFASPAAVRFGLDRVRALLPVRVAAPGQGTAECLRAAGVNPVIAPRRGAGLEALFDIPAVGEHLAGVRILLVCGRPFNRRNLNRLAALGARPQTFCSHERQAVTEAQPLAEWLHRGAADAIMASSVAAVEALVALGGRAGLDWSGIVWIVSSRQVAAAVRACEGHVSAVAASAHAPALVTAASTWWSMGR